MQTNVLYVSRVLQIFKNALKSCKPLAQRHPSPQGEGTRMRPLFKVEVL
jgi:hypothetical protein